MEIVIKIDDNIYKSIKNNGCIYEEENEEVALSIIGGTPLPKGHGRLIDLEEVRDRYVNIIKVSNSELENLRMLAEILDTSPTIIEADTESEVQHDKEDM